MPGLVYTGRLFSCQKICQELCNGGPPQDCRMQTLCSLKVPIPRLDTTPPALEAGSPVLAGLIRLLRPRPRGTIIMHAVIVGVMRQPCHFYCSLSAVPEPCPFYFSRRNIWDMSSIHIDLNKFCRLFLLTCRRCGPGPVLVFGTFLPLTTATFVVCRRPMDRSLLESMIPYWQSYGSRARVSAWRRYRFRLRRH